MGGSRITAEDVARKAGVSRATVSYVLNNHPHQTIPEATRQKVLEAAAELDYTPLASARILSRGRSDVVVMLIPSKRMKACNAHRSATFSSWPTPSSNEGWCSSLASRPDACRPSTWPRGATAGSATPGPPTTGSEASPQPDWKACGWPALTLALTRPRFGHPRSLPRKLLRQSQPG